MPKITVHGGPSIAGASVVGGSWSNEGDPDVWPEQPEAEDGGEESSLEDSPAPPSEPSPEPDYEAWTVEQLKEQLGERGLAKSGKRDDLVLRLLEDDDARAADPEAE